MKYLKHFESFENTNYEEHVQTIKDVFQDLIDEWDMEFIDGYGQTTGYGNYMFISSKLNGNLIINIFNKARYGNDDDYTFKHVSKSEEFNKDVWGHIGRLEKMGWSLVSSAIGDFYHLELKYNH